MQPELKHTEDGSYTLYVPELQEHYHSIHGAITESMHVFIENGWRHLLKNAPAQIHVLEVGMGTGLNVLLTARENKPAIPVTYYAIEPFPIPEPLISKLASNFSGLGLDADDFYKLHRGDPEKEIVLSSNVHCIKYAKPFEECQFAGIDLVYFDAFAPDVQPELWTPEVFQKLFNAMRDNAILVTYSAKGAVRRNMQKAGFGVERLPGPPFKREMLRATKL